MSEDPFASLEAKLKEESFPQVYLYKFICKSEDALIARVSALFKNEVELTLRPSKNGNFTSLSIKETALSAEEIIGIYREAAKIEGVIIL